MQLFKDIWRPIIVDAPIAAIVDAGSLDDFELHMLPALPEFTYDADPFGYWSGDILHIFVEHFDYRMGKGHIDVCTYDDRLHFIERRPVLREAWHLSYPCVFDADGETWMLPEACASGGVTLYRAVELPSRWEAAAKIMLDVAPVDATPLYHDGMWWLFYSPATNIKDCLTRLHVAYAADLTGPWTCHPANPVLVDDAGVRPGGAPILHRGQWILPVQDRTRGYGSAVRLLTIDQLDPSHFSARFTGRLAAPGNAAPYKSGLHTLSSAGSVTLIDTKRSVASLKALGFRPRRELRRLFGRPA